MELVDMVSTTEHTFGWSNFLARHRSLSRKFAPVRFQERRNHPLRWLYCRPGLIVSRLSLKTRFQKCWNVRLTLLSLSIGLGKLSILTLYTSLQIPWNFQLILFRSE